MLAKIRQRAFCRCSRLLTFEPVEQLCKRSKCSMHDVREFWTMKLYANLALSVLVSALLEDRKRGHTLFISQDITIVRVVCDYQELMVFVLKCIVPNYFTVTIINCTRVLYLI